MKSKMSFFNKGLIFSNLKRYSWTSAVWSVLLFLSVPLTIMTYELYDTQDLNLRLLEEGYRSFINRFGGAFANVMLCAFPVLIGMLVFRYLHSQRSSTVMHGLPFTRLRLFANSLFSGFVLMLIPLIINTAIVLIIKLSMPIGEYITYRIIFTWLLNSLCIAFCVFSLTVFVGMFTGNLIAHIVFTYIIHFLPFLLWTCIQELFTTLVYGYSYSQVPEFLTKFPMMYIIQDSTDCNLIYFLSGIVLLVMAFFVYRKRPAESAGDIVSFKFIRPIFKYGVTFCTAIFGYLIFIGITGEKQLTITLLIFVVVGYCLAQMLLSKSFRVWEAWKGLVVSLIVALAILGGIKTDITGFERRVPKAESIESITIMSSMPGIDVQTINLTQKEDIAQIRSMHEDLAGNEKYKAYNGRFPHETYRLLFSYTLTNGKTMERSYRYVVKEYENYLKPLYTPEKLLTSGIKAMKTEADEILTLHFVAYKYDYRGTSITGREKIAEFLDAYKSDIFSLSFENLVYNEADSEIASVSFEIYKDKEQTNTNNVLRVPDGSTIEITDHCHYTITDKYTNTKAWLEENVFSKYKN